MPCNCETYTCLNVVQEYNNCPTVLELQLEATQTATYSWEYEFNGRWFGGTVDVTNGENISLPFVFNEDYIHVIKLYYNNELVNDTCYKLDTSKIAGSYTASSTSGRGYLTFEVDANGATVTNADIANRAIVLIADGNQIYNSSGFTQAGNSFTMTNGVSFYIGQTITLVFA